MNKIVQINDSEVEIKNDAGQSINVPKSQINWDAAVGDSVNVYINGEDVNVTLAKRVGQKFNINIKFLDKKLLKVLMIGFSAALALFLIIAIIIGAKPHSSKYVYSDDICEKSLTFSGNTLTASTYYYSSKKSTEFKYTYRIEKGKLYYFYEDKYDPEDSGWEYIGTISSTEANVSGYTLKSNGTAFLKGFNTFLLVIAIILDGLCVAIFFLNKYGYATLSATPINFNFLKKNAGAATDNSNAAADEQPADEPTDEQPETPTEQDEANGEQDEADGE